MSNCVVLPSRYLNNHGYGVFLEVTQLQRLIATNTGGVYEVMPFKYNPIYKDSWYREKVKTFIKDGLTNEQMANRLSVSVSTIHRIKNRIRQLANKGRKLNAT